MTAARRAAAIALLLLASCMGMTAEEQQRERTEAHEDLRSGRITAEQHAERIAAIERSGRRVDWDGIGSMAGILLSTLLSVGLINSKMPLVGRGTRTQVRGLPESKLRKES